MTNMKKTSSLTIVLCALSFSHLCLSDEADDIDLDSFFSLHQKSTIEDFPLEEVSSEELSDAAIEGALQSTSSGNDLDAKPIYEEQKESSDKKKVSDTDKDKDKDQLEAERILKLSQPVTPPPDLQPVYITPSIRELHHQAHTVERE